MPGQSSALHETFLCAPLQPVLLSACYWPGWYCFSL